MVEKTIRKIYLETVRCFFIISEEKIEKCRYYYIGEDTYTFMMSRYIMAIYTAYQREKRQCWGGQHKVGGDFGSVVFYGKIRECSGSVSGDAVTRL